MLARARCRFLLRRSGGIGVGVSGREKVGRGGRLGETSRGRESEERALRRRSRRGHVRVVIVVASTGSEVEEVRRAGRSLVHETGVIHGDEGLAEGGRREAEARGRGVGASRPVEGKALQVGREE